MDILNNPDLLADAPSLLGFIKYFAYHAAIALFFAGVIGVLAAGVLVLFPRRVCECFEPKPGYGPNRGTCMECRRHLPVEKEIAHNE